MSESSVLRVVRRVHVTDAPYSNGLRCGGGGCPAIFQTNQGTYLVVGRRLSAAEKAELPMDSIEDALEVPKELLLESVAKLLGNK